MSSGGSGGGGSVARASVDIYADLTSYDAAMAALPAKSKKQIATTMKALQAEMARTKLEIKMAANDPNIGARSAKLQGLAAIQDQLKVKMAAVSQVAVAQAQAMQQVAIASNAASEAQKRYEAAADLMANSGVQSSAKMAKGYSNASYKLQVLGQGLDDLQYVPQMGLRPIINNLMQMSPILGIVAIGVNLIWSNFGKLKELWSGGSTETQAEEMKRLAEATSKTAGETARLIQLQERQKAAESQRTTKTKAQTEGQEARHEAITESPVGKVQDAIRVRMGKAFENSVDEDLVYRKKIADARLKAAQKKADSGESTEGWMNDMRGTSVSARRKEAEAAQQAIDEAINTRVEAFAADMEADPKKFADFVKDMERDPSKFGPGADDLLKRLQEATPEAIKQRKKAEIEGETAGEVERVTKEIYASKTTAEDDAATKARERTSDTQKAIERNAQEDPNGLRKGAAAKLMAEFQAAAKAEKDLYESGAARRKAGRAGMTDEARKEAERDEEARAAAFRARSTETADYLRDQQRKRDEPSIEAYSKLHGNQVLADIALGKTTDKGALTNKIAESMRKSGSTEEEIGRDAARFADLVIQRVTGTNLAGAQAEGVTAGGEAAKNLAKNSAEAQSAAGRGLGSVGDLVGQFHRNQEAYNRLMIGGPNEETAKNTRKTAQDIALLLAEVQKNGKKNGGLAGPP